VCPKSRGLIAKDFGCIAKVVARKKVSKIWRFSVVSQPVSDRSEEFFKVEWTRRKLVHVRQTEAGH
jgi:hypothetical protein